MHYVQFRTQRQISLGGVLHLPSGGVKCCQEAVKLVRAIGNADEKPGDREKCFKQEKGLAGNPAGSLAYSADTLCMPSIKVKMSIRAAPIIVVNAANQSLRRTNPDRLSLIFAIPQVLTANHQPRVTSDMRHDCRSSHCLL